MTPYESFQMFHSIQLHLTQKSYDIRKYRGKTFVKPHQFDKRRDKIFFHKLDKKYKKHLEMFYISSLSCGIEFKWVGDLLSEEFHQAYLDYRKRNEALKYHFEKDVDTIVEYLEESGRDFRSILLSNNGSPILIRLYEDNHISIETIIIINRLTDFISKSTLPTQQRILLTKFDTFVAGTETRSFGKILRNGVEKVKCH